MVMLAARGLWLALRRPGREMHL